MNVGFRKIVKKSIYMERKTRNQARHFANPAFLNFENKVHMLLNGWRFCQRISSWETNHWVIENVSKLILLFSPSGTPRPEFRLWSLPKLQVFSLSPRWCEFLELYITNKLYQQKNQTFYTLKMIPKDKKNSQKQERSYIYISYSKRAKSINSVFCDEIKKRFQVLITFSIWFHPRCSVDCVTK